MMDKPHLVLDWIFNIPENLLYCDITENLRYISHEGGSKGYTKMYRENSDQEFTESHVPPFKWVDEKFWISEHFGDIVGYYQPDGERVLWHPLQNRPDPSPNGVGPDGRYIDHMQRKQVVLEGEDCALIGMANKIMFVTPDNGKTIFKRESTRDVIYDNIGDPDVWYTHHPQPCLMQPRATGVQMSSYEEMLEAGISPSDVNLCKYGRWASPKNPELQKLYVYPTN